jgi:hypothetical protein
MIPQWLLGFTGRVERQHGWRLLEFKPGLENERRIIIIFVALVVRFENQLVGLT